MDGQLGSPLGLSWELPLPFSLPSFVSGEWLDLWDEQREGADRRERLRMCGVEFQTKSRKMFDVFSNNKFVCWQYFSVCIHSIVRLEVS